jgi:hypothetical protein
LLFGACSSSGSGSGAVAGGDNGVQLVRLFSSDKVIAAGREQRLPLGLLDNGAVVVGEQGSIFVEVRLGDQLIDQVEVRSRLVAHDHPDGDGDVEHQHADIARYFPLRTTLPEPGIYDLLVTVGEEIVDVPVQAFDPAEISVLLPGESMPALITPTLADPLEADTLCTQIDGPCPFHTRTVADVLDAREPLALLIASPAYCSTSYCGPVLDVLIESASNFPSIVPVHLEVYENPAAVGGNIYDPDLRPMPQFAQLGLDFEPALFLVDREGVVIERIDNVFDASELGLAMARLI